jgi:hypothetical protein
MKAMRGFWQRDPDVRSRVACRSRGVQVAKNGYVHGVMPRA